MSNVFVTEFTVLTAGLGAGAGVMLLIKNARRACDSAHCQVRLPGNSQLACN